MASDLVDHRLDDSGTEKALAHLTRCPECSAVVAAERQQRQLSARLEVPSAPEELRARLVALPARYADHPTPAVALDHARRRRAPMRLAVAGAAVTGAGLGVLALLGGPEHVTPVAAIGTQGLAQPVSVLMPDAASGDPLEISSAWPSGWPQPADLPPGVSITSSQVDSTGALVVDLERAGVLYTVIQRWGYLELDDAQVEERAAVGAVEAHAVGSWWVAQSGPTVVAVSGTAGRVDARELLESFPEAEPESGPVARLARGWEVLTGDA